MAFVDIKGIRDRIDERRRTLGLDLDYSHANKHGVRRVAKLKISCAELASLLDERDSLRSLLSQRDARIEALESEIQQLNAVLSEANLDRANMRDVFAAAVNLVADYRSDSPDGGATTYRLCKAVDNAGGAGR